MRTATRSARDHVARTSSLESGGSPSLNRASESTTMVVDSVLLDAPEFEAQDHGPPAHAQLRSHRPALSQPDVSERPRREAPYRLPLGRRSSMVRGWPLSGVV